MNLIEQLGGYEKASKFCDKEIKDGGYPYGLIDELLEHRRQHNIFEVGDSIVIHEYYDSTFMPVLEILEDCGSCFKTSNGVAVKSHAGYWRHATDEEIAAGHRL